MRNPVVFAALVSLLPATAVASETRQRTDAVGKADRVICKKVDVLGSRVNKKRVCQTAADWEAQRREQQTGVERNQRTQIQIGQ